MVSGLPQLGQLPPAQGSGVYAWVPREGFLKILCWLSPLHGAGRENIPPCGAQDVPRVFRDSGSSDGWLGSYCCNLHSLCQGWDSFVLHPFFLLMGKGEGVGNGALIQTVTKETEWGGGNVLSFPQSIQKGGVLPQPQGIMGGCSLSPAGAARCCRVHKLMGTEAGRGAGGF